MIIRLQHSMDTQYYYTEIEMGQSEGNTLPIGEMTFESISEWKVFNDAIRTGVREMGEVELIEEGREKIGSGDDDAVYLDGDDDPTEEDDY